VRRSWKPKPRLTATAPSGSSSVITPGCDELPPMEIASPACSGRSKQTRAPAAIGMLGSVCGKVTVCGVPHALSQDLADLHAVAAGASGVAVTSTLIVPPEPAETTVA
jgi:hypothetical protein